VQLSLKKVWKNPTYFFAFGFGSGLAPVAPGTFGTLAALPLYFLLVLFPPQIYLVVTLIAFVVGVWLCGKVSYELGVHDHGGIVWDEIVGFLLTMFLVPVHLIWVALGFVLFRIFDIWKPYPIRWVDKQVSGGLGIMLDDVLAAVPAFFLLHIISHLFPVGASG